MVGELVNLSSLIESNALLSVQSFAVLWSGSFSWPLLLPELHGLGSGVPYGPASRLVGHADEASGAELAPCGGGLIALNLVADGWRWSCFCMPNLPTHYPHTRCGYTPDARACVREVGSVWVWGWDCEGLSLCGVTAVWC